MEPPILYVWYLVPCDCGGGSAVGWRVLSVNGMLANDVFPWAV